MRNYFCLFRHIKQIRRLHDKASVGRAGEVVFLRAVVEIGKAEVIAAFHQEVAELGAQLCSDAAGNAVVELVVDGFALLFDADVGIVGNDFVHVARLLLAVADEEGYLRAYVEEELHSFVFAEGQVGQEGDFHIVHRAGVVYVRRVFVKFVPSALGEIDLYLRAAYHVEVFLGDIAGGQAGGDAHQVLLVHRGHEADFVHVDAPVHAYGEVVALLAHLCVEGKADEQEAEGGKYLGFHCRSELFNQSPVLLIQSFS